MSVTVPTLKYYQMKKLSHGTLAAAIIMLAVIVDQVVKLWVKTHFYYGEELEITSWFKLLFIQNNGMAFGWEMGSKFFLTWFRIIATVAFIAYLWKIRRRDDLPRGFVVCIALITAGALGNVLDCVFYGRIFDDPAAPAVAQLFPADGGYASWFNGKVVDMFYFPLVEWDWGGEHYVFFRPVFNVADSCLTVSIFTLILFYSKHLVKGDEKSTGEEEKIKDKNTTQPAE